jgi:hypothetical protein
MTFFTTFPSDFERIHIDRKEWLTSTSYRAEAVVPKPMFGYGACRSCDCPGYKPNRPKDDYCRVCGHSYYQHY